MFPSVLTLCLLCLSLQRNSSLSGSTRGMYQVSERRSSPSTGWVSNTLLVQSCTLDTPWDISFYHWTIKSFIKQVMRYTGNRTRRWDADRQKWQKASLHWSKNKTKHKQHNKWQTRDLVGDKVRARETHTAQGRSNTGGSCEGGEASHRGGSESNAGGKKSGHQEGRNKINNTERAQIVNLRSPFPYYYLVSTDTRLFNYVMPVL